MDVSHALTILIKGKTTAGPALKTAGDQVARLSKVVALAGKGLLILGQVGLTAVAAGATAAVAGVAALGAGIVSLTATLSVGFLKLTEYAAGLELMRRAMWGIAGEAVPAMLEALRESSAFMVTEQGLLRQYHMAYMLLGKDLADRIPEALQYLTKVSGATGDSVEFLVERMVRSVGRLSTRWMAYIGTVTTLQEAEVRAAEMFGKTTEELTRQDKMAGMLDLTLQKLAARTSIMPEILDTVKQMSEALKASWKDLWGDVTSHFLPVAKALFKILLKVVDVFKRLISEGGALYKPIRTVAAAFTVLYEVLGDLLDQALEVEEGATGALERFANNVISMAWKAVQWGSNIAVNLAIGIIRGASVALIGAMNFISSLLAHWLAPGSAPLVVSNILDWGASAFTEFLRGFSMADFDVIESVQAPLKRALAILVDLGEMGAEAAGEYFINLSEMMAEAIATGNLEAVFTQLGEIPGGYGESLVELFRRQIDLATAVEILAAAEERLAAARKNEEATGKQLSKQAREYNKLVREGADPAVLAAKLAEVKASYESLVLAREETEEAEDAVEEASEAVKLAREQVRLQERLLNQLIAMGEAFADLVRPGEDDEEPFVIPEIEWPEGYLLPIDEAFEALKESIRAKFAELWADLRAQWEESGVGQAIADLQERWERFYDETLVPLKEKLGEVWATFKGWVADSAWPWVLTQWEAWSAWWDIHGPGIIDWLLGIGDQPWSWKNLWAWVVEEWDKWVAWWEEDGPVITAAIEKIGTVVDDLLARLWTAVTGEEEFSWKGIWEKAGELFGRFVENAQIQTSALMAQTRSIISLGAYAILGDEEGFMAELWTIWWTGWNMINDLTGGKLSEIARKIYERSPEFWAAAVGLLDSMINAFEIKGPELAGRLASILTNAIGALLGQKWRIENAGHQLIDSLRDAISEKAWEIRDALERLVQDAIDAFMAAWGLGSPSTVMVNFGETLAESVALGIERFGDQPALAIQRMVDLTMGVQASPALGFQVPTAGGAPSFDAPVVINNYFGRDSIRSSQDVLQMADQIQRSLELKGVRSRIA